MKFSILGFDQKRVLSLSQKMVDKNGKEKTIQLDVTDLLIVKELADFMNRKRIIKYTFEDKTFFSIKYSAVIEDLPILNIKKQALSDRIDKIAALGVLEKKVVKDSNGTFTLFRIGDKYEELIYSPTSSEVQGGSYQTTNGFVLDYEPKDNTNNTITTNTKEIEDKSSIKKSPKDDNWRTSFDDYLALVNKAKEELLDDDEFYEKMNVYYPNADYDKTIDKMVSMFWGTEAGWQNKKSKRSKKINMLSTLKTNYAKNIVYKERGQVGRVRLNPVSDVLLQDGAINARGEVWSEQLKRWLK